MDTVSVQQSFIKRQCFDAAYDLIQAAIDIKSRYPEGAGHPNLLADPEVRRIILKLDNWTDYLVAKEGGL